MLAMMPMIVVVNMKVVLKCMHGGGDNGGSIFVGGGGSNS